MNLYSLVMGSIPLLIQLYADKYRQTDLEVTLNELENDLGLPRPKTYDFIIVGAGAAGCVLANRLSQNYTVLLLEAGGNPVPATPVQVFRGFMESHPAINYEYISVPQRYASLQTGGIISRKPGKMMGGSTSHHGGNYNRGHPLDYDAWAELTNDSSWKYENILQYFKKSENFIGHGAASQHGTDGEITVDTIAGPTLPTWFSAAKELGFNYSFDSNGPQTEGFAGLSITMKNGKRDSSYTSFIEPIEKTRTTLRIERYAFVSKILIDATKKAYGVLYKRHGLPQIAHASKEVIVSAGTFASPLLLIKSGIGRKDILEKAQIPVIVDLPVGNGIQEHTAVRLDPFTVNDTSSFPVLNEKLTESAIDEYLQHGTGPLVGVTGAQQFLVSSRAKKDGETQWPDLQLNFRNGYYTPPYQQELGIGFDVELGRPKSRGVLTLNSTAFLLGETDDQKLAIIDYNILSDPSDVDVLVEGIEMGLKIMENTTAFQRIGTEFKGEPHPGCTSQEFRSKDYWKCYTQQVGTTWLHFTGSCRMGANPDNSVVTSKLNVWGVSNLKIVDASVIPIIPNSNVGTPVVMIAEKASAEILENWHIK